MKVTVSLLCKSSVEAEHHPGHREAIRFLSRDFAEAYVLAEPVDAFA